MIVTKLNGGLGNQMFQYAAGLRLALTHRTRLALDISALADRTNETLRAYELGAYRVTADVVGCDQSRSRGQPRRSRLARIWARFCRRQPATPVLERSFHFDPAILDLPDGVSLRGYWQSERYFADVSDRVRSDLTLRNALTGRNAELAEQIGKCTAVSLHVRRGDYVSNPNFNATHGVCSFGYYQRAIAEVSKHFDDPVYFLFSDDPAWVRANFAIDASTVLVGHNGPDAAVEDLRLMSLCDHHVLANSSFSWWGAWLNPTPDKVVIAPAQWFQDSTLDPRDLIPAGWKTL